MVNWKEIHPDFTEELQKEWEDRNFSNEEVKEWIESGLTPQDLEFAAFLYNNDYKPQNLNNDNREELRKKYKEHCDKSRKSQEWLDKNYPKEIRSKVKEIYLNEPNLEGELDLGDFAYDGWLEVYISPRVDETKLTFKNRPEGAWIILESRYDAQTNVNFNYPTKEEKEKITKLDIRWGRTLQGDLDLSDFVNLKELDCRYNKLTSLNLSNCSQLEKVDCSNNSLTNLTLPTNPTNLKKIDLRDNNLPNQDLIDKYGFCHKCQQPNTNKNWCQPCAEREWQQDIRNLIEKKPFFSWFSKKHSKQLAGQELVKKFIQQQLLRETNKDKQLQWIPYEQFTNIEYLAEGGFSKIYKAKWQGKESGGRRYEKLNYTAVALKSLTNSQNLTPEFLSEVANTKLVDNVDWIVPCHGISQDPQTKNYVMVMEYIKGGNLRNCLNNEYSRLSWQNKLEKLSSIAHGLSGIHKQGLVHRDFHSGNILNYGNKSYITDLGLSQPANSQPEEGQIFGVLPYVAPEVLRGQPYTQKSDIYSFGIIAYEILTGLPPYCYKKENEDKYQQQPYDTKLAVRICGGERPQFQIKIPKLLEDLIKQCWDDKPENRPSVGELYRILDNLNYDTHFILTQQLQQAETHNQSLPEHIRFPKYEIHPGTSYYSKLINIKQIIQLSQQKELQINQNILANPFIKRVKECLANIHTKLTTPISEWDCCQEPTKKDKGKEVVREEVQQAQIEIPPKK